MEMSGKMYEKLTEELVEIFDNMCDGDLRTVWNDYCDYECLEENYAHEMWEINDVLAGLSPGDVIESLGSFDKDDDYFTYDGCEINSYNDVWDVIQDSYRDSSDLAEFILDGERYKEGEIPELNDFWEDVRFGKYNESDEEENG